MGATTAAPAATEGTATRTTTELVGARARIEARAIATGDRATWLIEATWLVLLVALPAAFNPAGTLAFEPLKMSLLRVGAAVAAAAWLVRRAARSDVIDVGANPLVRAGLLFIALGAVSTLFSIEPALSLFGSFDRGMGWLSLAAGAVVLLCAADVFAEDTRRERLVTALVLGAVAPCAYLFVQHFGRDPIGWTTLGPPASSMASPTFLGGYLVMVCPFAVYRVVRSARSADLGYAGWLALLLIICTATLLTTIRGTILGMCAALVTFAVVAAARRAHLLLGLGLLCAVVVGLAGGAGLSRFLSIARAGDSTVGRLTVWRDALALPLSDPWRALIGSGPETQAAVLERAEATVRLTQNQQWDRAHNFVLDTWLTQGAAGVIALAVLIGLTALSLWRMRRATNRLLVAAVLGALVGHLVEVSFAFESVTSSMLFWLLVGLAAGLSPRRRPRVRLSPALTHVGAAAALALAPLLAMPAIADLVYGQARLSNYATGAQLEESAAGLAPWVEELPRAAALDWQHVSTANGRVETDLLMAAARAPLDPFPALRLTRWYLLGGDLADASAWCDRALTAGPYRAAVWDSCADVSQAQAQTDLATQRRARADHLRQPL